MNRDLHLKLLRELADELGVDESAVVLACDESGAQAVACDWEDDWPSRGPRKRHGWKNNAVAERLRISGENMHHACLAVGVLFVQAGDERAGSSAFFRTAART